MTSRFIFSTNSLVYNIKNNHLTTNSKDETESGLLYTCMRISLPLEVTRAARGLAKNLEKEKPRHPYIELAVNFKAFCRMSYCILQKTSKY